MLNLTSRSLTLSLVLLALLLHCLVSCTEETAPESSSDNEPVPTTQSGEALAVVACERLFGTPNENTGLSNEQCAPECLDCQSESAGGASAFLPLKSRNYSSEELNGLRGFLLKNAPELLDESPYLKAGSFTESPSEFCGAIFEKDSGYRLMSFSSKAEAIASDAVITHEGACGACSSLQDLAVYIEIPDLTEPVRNCALNQLGKPAEATIPCLQALGFSSACAEIWAYNTKNTRDECFSECISAIDEPYHFPDGTPNECISCDEEKSGPVFKAVSGRTRRNSGLPTALCRPCAGVARLSHDYP